MLFCSCPVESDEDAARKRVRTGSPTWWPSKWRRPSRPSEVGFCVVSFDFSLKQIQEHGIGSAALVPRFCSPEECANSGSPKTMFCGAHLGEFSMIFTSLNVPGRPLNSSTDPRNTRAMCWSSSPGSGKSCDLGRKSGVARRMH